MKDCRVTLASLPSLLADVEHNLGKTREAVEFASRSSSRLVVLPELMLTGHGAHSLMARNAEPVPDGPLSREVLRLSKRHRLCVCAGIAELRRGVVYNSMLVADRGESLGCQSKLHLSGDECCYFAPGQSVEIFDIGELRFGITICYDSCFHELALLHNLDGAEAVLSAHAARCGDWPAEPDEAFMAERIEARQRSWECRYAGIAQDYNFYVLLCNAVGSSTAGLEGVVANHAGTVMAIDPSGEVILRTSKTDFTEELATVDLHPGALCHNHPQTRNRRLETVIRLLEQRLPAPVTPRRA